MMRHVVGEGGKGKLKGKIHNALKDVCFKDCSYAI
jgi:hypothetical protein